jgi:nicotinamidase-related amidase
MELKEVKSMSQSTALLVIDVQNGMFDPQWPIYEEEKLLANIRKLIAQARKTDTPVIFIQHTEKEGPLTSGLETWQIHPDLAPRLDETKIAKTTPDAFHQTRLKEILTEKAIRNLVIAGLQSEYCIDATCRRAFNLGFKTTLVSDAHSTMDSESQKASAIISHINQTLGSEYVMLSSTDDVRFKP